LLRRQILVDIAQLFALLKGLDHLIILFVSVCVVTLVLTVVLSGCAALEGGTSLDLGRLLGKLLILPLQRVLFLPETLVLTSQVFVFFL
jgi:hypothetical protein